MTLLKKIKIQFFIKLICLLFFIYPISSVKIFSYTICADAFKKDRDQVVLVEEGIRIGYQAIYDRINNGSISKLKSKNQRALYLAQCRRKMQSIPKHKLIIMDETRLLREITEGFRDRISDDDLRALTLDLYTEIKHYKNSLEILMTIERNLQYGASESKIALELIRTWLFDSFTLDHPEEARIVTNIGIERGYFAITLHETDYIRCRKRISKSWNELSEKKRERLLREWSVGFQHASEKVINSDFAVDMNLILLRASAVEDTKAFKILTNHESAHTATKQHGMGRKRRSLNKKASEAFEAKNYRKYLKLKHEEQLNFTQDEIIARAAEVAFSDRKTCTVEELDSAFRMASLKDKVKYAEVDFRALEKIFDLNVDDKLTDAEYDSLEIYSNKLYADYIRNLEEASKHFRTFLEISDGWYLMGTRPMSEWGDLLADIDGINIVTLNRLGKK